MKRICAWFVTGIVVAVTAGAQAGSSSEDLWEQARRIYAAAGSWTPGRTESIYEKLDERGRVTSTTVVVHAARVGAGGAVVSELVSSVTDGRDTTGMQRRNEADGKPNPYAGGASRVDFRLDSSPFDDRERANVSAERTAQTRAIDRKQCRGYRFVWRLPDISAAYNGIAWIDEASGAPVLLEYSMDPRPGMLSAFTVTESYTYRSPTEWYLTERRIDRESRSASGYSRLRSTDELSAHLKRG